MKWIVGILALVGLVAIFGDLDEQTSESEILQEVTSPGTVPANTPTTELLTSAPVGDLPTFQMGDDDLLGVLAAENLLDSLGMAVRPDARWDDAEQSTLDDLRRFVGLGAGGLTEDLWAKIFELPSGSSLVDDNGKPSGFGELLLPTQAVAVAPGVRDMQTIGGGTYLLPFDADVSQVTSWFGDRFAFKDLEDWRWCDASPWGIEPTQYSWWQRSGQLLSLTVEDRGFGRVDIGVALRENQSIGSCQGAARGLEDLRIDSTEFRWRDSGLDWVWRPVGTYTNNSDTSIVYAQVTYEITGANGYTARYVDDPMDDLAPGKTARIMPENWFRLGVSDFNESQIGMELSYGSGATFIGYVNYIRYADGTSVGTEKFIN